MKYILNIVFFALLLSNNSLQAQPRAEQRLVAGPTEKYYAAKGRFADSEQLYLIGDRYALKFGLSSSFFDESGQYRILSDTLFLYHDKNVPTLYWMFIVPWMEYEILLKNDQMIDFANDYNSGRLFHYQDNDDGRYLNSQYMTNIPREAVRTLMGKPNFPGEYKNLLLDQSIVAFIKSKDQETCNIILNVGSEDGVFTGMKFFVRDNYQYQGVVIEVTPNSCKVQDLEYYQENKVEEFRARMKNKKKRNREFNSKEIEIKVPHRTQQIFNSFAIGDTLSTYDIR